MYVFFQPFSDEQVVTQGQFLKWNKTGLKSIFLSPHWVTLPKLKNQLFPNFYPSLVEKERIHMFPKDINSKWISNGTQICKYFIYA